jgi:hypothetical protein
MYSRPLRWACGSRSAHEVSGTQICYFQRISKRREQKTHSVAKDELRRSSGSINGVDKDKAMRLQKALNHAIILCGGAALIFDLAQCKFCWHFALIDSLAYFCSTSVCTCPRCCSSSLVCMVLCLLYSMGCRIYGIVNLRYQLLGLRLQIVDRMTQC